MNSIFGKPLEEVEYQDVIAFCDQQVKEGLNLDYKRDTSNMAKVVKTLVSFANTNGGWVIIGVDDEDDKPKLPVTGMSYAETYEQNINNSIVSTVSPVVLPTYKAVTSPDGKFTIVIAYMHMSPNTPHWMNNGGKNILYTRVADRASGQEWEQYASSNSWEMLQAKRTHSIELRTDIAKDMRLIARKARYEDEMNSDDPFNFSQRDHSVITLPSTTPVSTPDEISLIRIIPEFPYEQLLDVKQIAHRLNNEVVSVHPSYSPTAMPETRGYSAKTYQQGGYISYKHEAMKNCYFFGLDVFGSLLNINPVQRTRGVTKQDGKKDYLPFVSAMDIIASVVGALRYAGKLYSDINHDTLLRIECKLDVAEGSLLFHPNMNDELWPRRADNQPRSLTGEYNITRTANASNLADKVSCAEIAASIIDEVFHSFNYSYYNPEGLKEAIESVLS